MGLYFAIPLVLFIIVLLWIVPVGLWLQAIFSIGGGHITIFNLVGMRFRRVPPSIIVNGLISINKAGIEDVSSSDLEVHYMAGGDVNKVVDALISASKAGLGLTFSIATAIDLAGRDVLAAVQTSVYPKVIDAPVEGKLSAVAKDGIEVRAKARVTVRTDIPNLVGGATEDTIIARVGEGIVSAIGSKETYEAVLENPDSISKTVLDRGLNKGTAFEILSIDIADIDVGKNIGAQLQADQAEADLRVAQAKAETRRAMAVALEQEMKAKVVEAESEVPKAMAQAFREGNLGVMDYYKLNNVAADTSMRESIASTGEEQDISEE
jgi:uncharacterized protein YqfA (UPF0365 family)